MSNLSNNSIKIIQNVDQAISVMHSAATWLLKSGKKPNKWWQPQNMNHDFLLKHAEQNEFYVAIVNGKPAAAVILQNNERNQSWKSIDKENPKQALYLHWLCVEREFASKNLPKVMVDFANNLALKRNIKLLRLDTNANESKLREIYKNLGFSLMGIEKNETHNTAYYQKTIILNS